MKTLELFKIKVIEFISLFLINKSCLVSLIESLYKKHLLPGFDDRQQEEQSIERISEEITLVRVVQNLSHLYRINN